MRLARFNVLSMGAGGAPTKPGKYIVGLPTPPAAGTLVGLVVANHAAGNIVGPRSYAVVISVITAALAFFMVSSVRFRSFKDLQRNVRSAALIGFVIISSVGVAVQSKPAFVLLWLLVVYVAMGIGEWLWHIPGRVKKALSAPTDPAMQVESAAPASLAAKSGPNEQPNK
ncbi:MAG TPA: hypothetical protein ENK23_03775 [Sorangium sp.]|nr:hypothetical protein [Sorangium sp.]